MSMPFADPAKAKLQTELKEIKQRADRGFYRNKTRAHNKRAGVSDPRDTGKWPVGSLWK